MSIPTDNPSTSAYLSTSVAAAVRDEIDGLGVSVRPGLAAAAMALARILDNPKAISSQSPAAAQLVNILERMRKSAAASKPRLASVRRMTKNRGG